MKKNKTSFKKKNLRKKRIIKKYGFCRLAAFSQRTQPNLAYIFLNNFLLFYLFKVIKSNYFNLWTYKGRMRKKKRIFLRSFYRRKHLTLRYKLLRKLYFKIFQFSEIIDSFDIIWTSRQKKYFINNVISTKYNTLAYIKNFKNNKLFYFNDFFRQQDYYINWCNLKVTYKFTRNFIFRYSWADFMLRHSNHNKELKPLFFIPTRNTWILRFNFKVHNFNSLVRENNFSELYRCSFKLDKNLVVKKTKEAFFTLKIKHIRWLQTHINFILHKSFW